MAVSEELLINIISTLEDSGFQDAIGNLENLDSTVSETVSGMEEMADVGSSGMEEIISASGGAASAVGEVEEAMASVSAEAENMGATGSDAMDKISESSSIASGALQGIAALGIPVAFYGAANSAGDFADSMGMLEIASNKSGISIETSSKMASELTDQLGTSGGAMRSFVGTLEIFNVSNQKVIRGLAEGARGLAYLGKSTGATFESMSQGIQKSIAMGTISIRTFGQQGIGLIKSSIEEAGQSFDEFKAKFESATQPERAQMLNDVLSQTPAIMEAASKASESFDAMVQRASNSFQGLIRRFGELVMPSVIMFLEMLSGVLGTVNSIISALPGPVKSLLTVLLTLVGGVGMAVFAFSSLKTVMATLGVTKTISTLMGLLGPMAAGSKMAQILAFATGKASLSFGILGKTVTIALIPLLKIIAVIGAVVGAIYLIGNALGYWKDLPGMFEAISKGLGRIWDSFINNKHVVGIINAIKQAWDDFVKFFVDGWNSIFGQDLAGDFNFVGAIIDYFGMLGDAVAMTIGVIDDFFRNNPFGQILSWFSPFGVLIYHLEDVWAVAQWVWNGIADFYTNNPFGQILGWLNPITILLFHLGDLWQMAEALAQAWEDFANSAEGVELFTALNEVFTELQSAMGEVMVAFGEMWDVLFPPDINSDLPETVSATKDAINGVNQAVQDANPYLEAAKQVIQGVAFVLQNYVIPYLQMLVWVFSRMAEGIRVVTDGMNQVQNTFNAFVSGQIGVQEVIMMVWGAIVNFMTMIWGIIIAKATSFGTMILSRIASIFSNMVNTAKSFVSKLPGIVYQEMINVANKIGSAGPYIFSQVQATFGNIVKWAKQVLGIASPGFIANAVSGEMGYLVNSIADNASRAYSATRGLASSILAGFGNPVLPRVENEGVAPWNIGFNSKSPKPVKGGGSGGGFPVPLGGSPSGASGGSSGDTVINVEVKNQNTFNVDGGGNPDTVVNEIEKLLASDLPEQIIEALIRGLNKQNISKGNI